MTALAQLPFVFQPAAGGPRARALSLLSIEELRENPKMRSRLLLPLFAVAALHAGSAAQAGVLAAATWTQSIQSNDLTVSNTGGTCAENSPVVVLNDTSLGGVPCPTSNNPAAVLGATGSATATSYDSKFAPLPTPTIVATGSFNLTANGGGTVTLVAPSKISIDGLPGQRRTASFTTLKLTYAPDSIPEPATLLLLGAAVPGLALVARCKR